MDKYLFKLEMSRQLKYHLKYPDSDLLPCSICLAIAVYFVEMFYLFIPSEFRGKCHSSE